MSNAVIVTEYLTDIQKHLDNIERAYRNYKSVGRTPFDEFVQSFDDFSKEKPPEVGEDAGVNFIPKLIIRGVLSHINIVKGNLDNEYKEKQNKIYSNSSSRNMKQKDVLPDNAEEHFKVAGNKVRAALQVWRDIIPK